MYGKERFIRKYEEREKGRDAPAYKRMGSGENALLYTGAKSPEETLI